VKETVLADDLTPATSDILLIIVEPAPVGTGCYSALRTDARAC
jgi:hypothetical protein